MKRILPALALTAALTLSLCPAASAQESEQLPPGTEIGKVYATDIIVYLDGHPVPAYNVDNRMVILLEDMIPYGYSVAWDPDHDAVYLDAVERPEHYPSYAPVSLGSPGQVVGSVQATNIQVYANGLEVESVNLGGKTAVFISSLGYRGTTGYWHYYCPNDGIGYSYACFQVSWNPETSTSALQGLHPGDFLKGEDGASYPVTGFLNATFSNVQVSACIYLDGEMVFGGAHQSCIDSCYYHVDLFADLFQGDDYSWSFELGEVRLTLPETISDRFFVGHRIPEGLELEYPRLRTLTDGTFRTQSGVVSPLVLVPVHVEQAGQTRTFHVQACVFRSDIFISISDFFDQLNLSIISE